MPLDSFPSVDARVEKKDGSIVGPYKTIFAGDTIFIKDAHADVEEDDVVLRTLPSGKEERSHVTRATFFDGTHGIAAHYQLKFRKGGTREIQKPNNTFNFHGSQQVQIGDHNTQNIVNALQDLKNKIDGADVSLEEKQEANALFGKFIAHPLVTSVLGGLAGGLF
ncbi:MAG: hypothetical protein ACXW3B_12495 [Telluria sp.]